MQGNVPLITAVLLAWPPVVVASFRLLGRRGGTLVGVVGGYLWLPSAVVSGVLPRWVQFDKHMAIGLSLALAVLVWDRPGLRRFRPRVPDVPFLALTALMGCVALAGQYVVWEVAHAVALARVWWLAPYLAGRLYFGNADGARRVGVGVVVGSLLYVPVVAFEAVMGPPWYLRTLVYGLPSDAGMVARLGGWRPEGFLNHGIELSCWMAVASVMALWLWLGGAWRPRRGPAWWPTAALAAATAATRGVYGYIDLAAGALVVVLTVALRSRAALVALALTVPFYVGLRASGAWDGRALADLARAAGRESTVASRLACEDRMAAAVLAHNPAFGFGRPLGVDWGGGSAVPTPRADGGWLVSLWTGGLIGLGVQLAAMLLVPVGLALAYPPGRPDREQVGSPVWGLALFTTLNAFDSLHNMPNFVPVALAIGSIVGITVNGPKGRSWSGPDPGERLDARPKAPRERGRPPSAVVTERHLGRDLARFAAVLAVLAAPEILGALTGSGPVRATGHDAGRPAPRGSAPDGRQAQEDERR